MSLRESQSQHWAGKDLRIIESYMNSPPATQRSLWYAGQLKNYNFNSIFEVGYFSGRNIKYIKEAFPNVKISGLEINQKAARFAREKLNMGEELLCMNLHDMHKIIETFDVIFTSGVLIHVPPDDIPSVVQKMLGRANKYVMHIEQIGDNSVTAGPKHLKPSYKVSDQLQFAPDLLSIYKDLGLETEVIPLPDDCKTNGAAELVVVKL